MRKIVEPRNIVTPAELKVLQEFIRARFTFRSAAKILEEPEKRFGNKVHGHQRLDRNEMILWLEKLKRAETDGKPESIENVLAR